MSRRRLDLTRGQILSFRRHVGALGERLAGGSSSLRRAAWAGLQDSVPRAALLSIHARVEGTAPSTWEDPSLVQLWGPRFCVFVVPKADLAVFSLGTLRDEPKGRKRAYDVATEARAVLGEERLPYGEAGDRLGFRDANRLRYGAATGTLLIRWEGAGQPTIWAVAPPEVDPLEARLELARRYLHIYGPTTAEAFGRWAGVKPRPAAAAFEALASSLLPVRTPIGDAWILATDEAAVRSEPGRRPGAPARLLPTGDPYLLLWGADRDLMVPEKDRRSELWTSRVWPGGVLVDGEVVGTWRRSDTLVSVQLWRRLSLGEHDAVAAEAESLPVARPDRPITLRFED